MNKDYFCAIDLGAGSGRIILSQLLDGRFHLKEIHRFDEYLVFTDGHYRWDINKIIYEINSGLNKIEKNRIIKSVGLDTWGVDFVMLNENDELTEQPIAYRDSRTDGMMELLDKRISKKEIYNITGIQFMKLNTLYQLLSISNINPKRLENVSTCLLMPDYLAFLLIGKKGTEYTIASTTQLLNLQNKNWSNKLFDVIDVKENLFPPVHESGKIMGSLKKYSDHPSLKNSKFISVGSHDTASAIAAVPAGCEDWIYISSGTWSLMGIEAEEPILNETAFENNFTNEGGVYNTFRFLKNIMGLWLLQKLKKELDADKSFDEIVENCGNEKPFQFFIDVDNENFINPESMVDVINKYLIRTGQQIPKKNSEYFRLVLDCLALKYYETFLTISEITNKEYSIIHIIGGGSKNSILCQQTADLTGCSIIAGPTEATAIGNVMVQAISMGLIKDVTEGRRIVKSSFYHEKYLPDKSIDVKDVFNKYSKFKII
ncbi:MAG: rhamnulokinase [Melioribacteraceae bacterium]|nr:rhamnulokinase [Melioribacteraceae bacterium]